MSGHGFGHASRDIEVINAILASRPDVAVIARTSAAKWLFDRTIGGAATSRTDHFRRSEALTDTGAVQIDSLHLDEAATVQRAREFMRTFDERVDAEVAFLRDCHATLVVSDIPALGIAAARRAGLRVMGFGNFTWDWIYAAYAGAEDIAAQLGEIYAMADAALRLPMHGGFATFNNIIDLPFVARRSSRDRDEVSRVLGLPCDKRLVLLSFGGYGLERINDEALATLDGYDVIGSRSNPLNEDAMYDAGLRYEDLVRAVDVVVTKPGYGIISECIANDTALLYTSRGHFVEYDVMVAEMPRYLRSRFIGHDDLFGGRWQAHLEALLAAPPAEERPAVNGAEIAADLILEASPS